MLRELDFLSGLGEVLRPPEILTLLVCQRLEKQDCYLDDIAKATGQSDVSARRCLRKLQRLGHLVYTVHNRGSDDPNYEILWARKSLAEKAPGQAYAIRQAKAIKLWHPEHGNKTIEHGKIRRFVDAHNVNYPTLIARR